MQAGELDVKGLRLAVQTAGDPAGAPVLATHGWLDNSESFRALAAAMPDRYWVCLDFPGHGLSQHRPAGSLYHMSEYVSDVAGALDALGWSRAMLVGHSMGAGVASLVAAAMPERVDGLVLIEGLGPMSANPDKAVDSLRTATRGLLAETTAPQARFEDAGRAIAARRMATPDVDPAALEAIVRRNLRDVDGGLAWRTDPRLRLPSPQPYDEASVLALLGAIRAPVLLIEGDRGYLRDRRWFERRVQRLRDVRHIVVAGDHHLHTGAAALDIAAAIDQFCADTGRGESQ